MSKPGYEIDTPWYDMGAVSYTHLDVYKRQLYDYGYAGCLPLAGSELLCLELLEYALDEGLSLGVHYCSLENKHRDQICVQNGACSVDAGVYERDPHDFFLKTVKAFDGDVSLARRALEACGVGAFSLEDEGLSLAFHPRHISICLLYTSRCV